MGTGNSEWIPFRDQGLEWDRVRGQVGKGLNFTIYMNPPCSPG